jgi:hypothetical protein
MKNILIFFLALYLTKSAQATELKMQAACDNGQSITIGAVGDFLMHEPFQRKAANYHSFIPLWKKWLPYTQGSDIMYGNLETPTAPGLDRQGHETSEPNSAVRFDNVIYTSYELFNLHPQLVSDIKKSGWSIVSTANNHALDRGDRGVEKTIDELNRAGLTYVGTRKKDGNFENEGYRIIEKNGISTAWIACTAIYNIRDTNNLLLGCEKNAALILNLIKSLKNKVDAIIVTPHWGEEMADVNAFQKRFGHELVEAGATAVIGAHPHVLQPLEKVITRDGRETIIAYSMGNFLGFHPHINQKATMMLFVNLVKTAGITKIRDVQYMPALIRNRTGDLNDVQVLPINRNGQLIGENEVAAERGQNYGQAAIKRMLSLFPEENLVEFGTTLNFKRGCHQ